MSTKLYDGFVVEKADFWNVVQNIREVLEETFENLNNILTMNLLKGAYSKYAVSRLCGKEEYSLWGDSLMLDALENSKNEKEDFFRDPLFCNVQLFEPLDDGRILGYVFSHNKSEYYDAVLSLSGVSEFGYWNNTDKPDSVSEEEWNERRELWNNILEKNYYLTGSGVSVGVVASKERTFSLGVSDGSYISGLLVGDSFRDNVAKRISVDVVSNAAINELGVENEDFNSVVGIVHDSMRVVNDSDVVPVYNVPVFDSVFLLSESPALPSVDENILAEVVSKVVRLNKN